MGKFTSPARGKDAPKFSSKVNKNKKKFSSPHQNSPSFRYNKEGKNPQMRKPSYEGRKPSFETFKPVSFKPSSFTSSDSEDEDSDEPQTLHLGKTLSEEEQRKFMSNKVFSNVHNKNKHHHHDKHHQEKHHFERHHFERKGGLKGADD